LEPILSFDIEYKDIVPEKSSIEVNSENIKIFGVSEYQISNKINEIHPLAKKRVESKKKLVIMMAISILTIIFAVILVTSLSN
jgi:predicted nucleic acid-binding Zn ribbon protein